MGDKCDAHDDCFKRLYTKMETFDGKQDRLFGEVREMLHAIEINLAKHEMRIEQLEQKAAQPKTVDWPQFFVDILKEVVRWGIFAGGAAAWWAVVNGYGR